MTDQEVILDALAGGLTIKAAADRFDMPQNEVRALLKEEAERCYDGAEMRQEWALASRRFKRMELAFHERAMEQMDPSLAVIALKANERRASLSGAGSAAPSHLIAVMHAKAIEEAPSSTEQIRRVLDELIRTDPKRLAAQMPPSEPK